VSRTGKICTPKPTHHDEIHGCILTTYAHRRAQTWPQDMILLPSDTKRLNNAALEEWIKRYDPMWCQFVPHHNEGGNDTVMNDLVHRQLVQRLIDQCLVSFLIIPKPSYEFLIYLPISVRRRVMGRPKLPRTLEHSPPPTLQHVRANRSRLLKRRKARTTDPVRTKLARGPNPTLRRPDPKSSPDDRTPILLSVPRTDTSGGEGSALPR
jgi:hypothetical protein